MKTIMRSFSVGILTATIIIGITLLIQKDSSDTKELSIESATEYLNKEGYQVVENKILEELNATIESQKTQIESFTSDKPKEEQQPEATPNESTNEENEKEENKPVTIEIVSGMTTDEVATILLNAKLIDNEGDFIKYLEDNNYATLIQIGKFELKSGMSYFEIAEQLTK